MASLCVLYSNIDGCSCLDGLEILTAWNWETVNSGLNCGLEVAFGLGASILDGLVGRIRVLYLTCLNEAGRRLACNKESDSLLILSKSLL